VRPDEHYLVRLAMSPGPPALRLLRTRIHAALPHVRADVVADIELVATELVTNAYLHGDQPVEFHLRAGERDGMIRVEVFDGGAAMPMVRHPDVRTFNGRGMLLVEAFSQRWGVTAQDDGKTVWAELATD
jgi:anti-sigma regulatory factor (Ser/Thr protein kinase)